MNEQPFDTSPPTPSEQLANLYDSLADDVLLGFIEIDEDTNRRAARVVGVVPQNEVGLGGSSDPAAKVKSQPHSPWKTSLYRMFNADSPTTSRRKEGLFAQRFGLHPGVALGLTAVGLLFTAFAWGTLGAGSIIELPLAPICGFLTALMQRHSYQDDFRTSLFKGLAVTVLLAVPIPLAPFVFIPAGIIGIVGLRKMKPNENKVLIVVATPISKEHIPVNRTSRDGTRREEEKPSDNK